MIKRRSYGKYKNKKVIIDGIAFHSKKEGDYYKYLKIMVMAKEVVSFEMQVPYELIPSQRIEGKVVERACKYYADFVVTYPDRVEVVDVKGSKETLLPEYIIKRKLMLQVHNIKIVQVFKVSKLRKV